MSLRSRETDTSIFEKAALNGKVVDKDGVKGALQRLPSLYGKVGVPKKDARRLAEQAEKHFDGADRIEQVQFGQHLINIVNAFNDAVEGAQESLGKK